MLDFVAEAWHRSPLRTRLDALSPRERLLVAVAATIIAGLVFYAAVKPLLDFRSAAVARQAAEYADLLWMEDNREAAALSIPADGMGSQALSTINAVASGIGLKLRRIQPEGEGFSVQVDGQPFNTVVQFTHTIERRGLEIASASIDLQDAGFVTARFSVR
jgi:type II secretory pathway component PulM